MGLIINRLKQLLKGYPTVSDKYNVAGGTYEGTEGLEVGEPVSYGSTTGYYVAYDAAKGFAGISMAKNVKLINQYPANGATVKIEKGEAIDLFVDGYIAVELANDMLTVTDGVLTSDATFQAGKDYYTRSGSEGAYTYTKASVTVGAAVTADTYYEATATEITPIAEGTKAYVNADGKFTSTSSSNVEVGKFTGITETNYGKALAEIVVK